MKDRRGTEIKVGQRVAYNFQGMVSFGEITSIEDEVKATYEANGRDWNFGCKAKIKIKQLEEGSRRISTVTNPLNLLVIREGEF